MIVIEINNSTSKITGLVSSKFNKLRKLLSYTTNPTASYFAGNYNRPKYVIDKQGVFATGLLNRVINFLIKEKIQFEEKDLRIASILKIRKIDHKPDFSDIIPYTWQKWAAKVAEDSHRGIVSACTGSGKSLVIALIASRLSVRTLIVVPNLEIKEQLTDSLKRVFKDMSNITVENIDSNALKTATDYDLLIIDEAHHVAAKTYQKLNKSAWKGIYYRIFLTATPFRNQTEETLLFEGIAGQVIYELSYKEAVSKGYVVPVEAYYIEIPKVETDAYTWQEVYSQLVVNNKPRNQAIGHLMASLAMAKISTLCLVKEIQHGNNIASIILSTPFANGQDETTRHFIKKFNSGELLSLIGTTGMLGEGVDTKPCEYVIIAGLGKAKSAFMQQVGRAIRIYPDKHSAKIILIKDKSHKFLLKHFQAQVKILRGEYGVTPMRLEI